MLVPTADFLRLLLTGWSAQTPDLLRWRFYKNDYVPNRFSTGADFVECDFEGYSFDNYQHAIWQICTAANGQAEGQGARSVDHPTIVTGNVVYGWYATLAADPSVCWAAARFDQPVPIVPGPSVGLLVGAVHIFCLRDW